MYRKIMYGGAWVTAHDAEVDLYTPSEEVAALHLRQRDSTLMREVVRFANAGPELLRALSTEPLVLWRHLPTPNHETRRFLELARLSRRPPLLLTFEGDWFEPGLNAAKRHLAKIVVGDPSGQPQTTVRIVQPTHERQRLCEVRCRDGSSLSGFHRAVFAALHPGLTNSILDIGGMRSGGGAQAHYERLFALLTCCGALADTYSFEGPESSFSEKVVVPAYQAVLARFGARPAIVRLLPAGAELAPYWEWYPHEVLPYAIAASQRAGPC